MAEYGGLVSAQPIHGAAGGDDPAAIHNALRPELRAQFLREYKAAAQAAAEDLDAYGDLVRLLRLWRGRAVMDSRPGAAERAAAAQAPRPDTVPIEDVVPDWPEQLRRRSE